MTEKKQPGILDRIENIDRKVIYFIVTLAVILPLINPIGLPLNIAEESVNYKNAIDDIPDGSNVLCKIDMEAGLSGELGPAGVATINQLLEKPVKLVFIFFYRGDCPLVFVNNILPNVNGYIDTTHLGNKVYGVDWVSLGYIEGHESAMAKLAEDMHFVTVDQFGNKMSDLPLMQDIKTASDFSLLIHVGGGDNAPVLNQFSTPYKLKTICATAGVDYVGVLQYYKAGVYSGILNSLKGTAEYEFLLGQPGLAIVATDAISVIHVTLLVLIIIGNAIYIYKRMVKKDVKGGVTE